jgi:tetratricopeptide (TPR) repeat protein
LHAQPKPNKAALKEAKTFFETAETHYRLQEFSQALDAYKESYRISQHPELLFNIAQCYRKLERYEEALLSYQSFLRDVPKAKNRAEVEAHIANLQKLLAERAAEAERIEQERLAKEAERLQQEQEAAEAERLKQEQEAAQRAAELASQPSGPATSSPVFPEEEKPRKRGRVLLGAGAAVLAGGLASGGFALAGAQRASDLQDQGDASASRAQLDRAFLLGNLSTGLCAAGAAGLLSGIILGRLAPRNEALSLAFLPSGLLVSWEFLR